MTLQRRRMLTATFGALITTAGSAGAQTASWPNQPIRIIVPYPAGGGTDFFARTVAPGMSEALKQTVLVENRPGASGAIGASAVAKLLPADGYSILLGDMGINAVNPSLYPALSYDPVKDLVPVTMTAKFDYVLVVNPKIVPARNIGELVALSKKSPSGLDYASPATGSTHHLATELLARETGAKFSAIPYKGAGPAIQDLLGGQVGLMFLDRASARPHLESGALKAIAVGSAKRLAALPDVPTLAEQGVKGFEVEGWQGFSVRAGTAQEHIRLISKAYEQALQSLEVRRKLNEAGIEPAPSTPDAYAKFIRSEAVRWSQVIKERGIKAE